MRPRVIPVLLIKNNGLVKTTTFKNDVYVGDPINAVRLFNDLEVDEIIVLDITATREKRSPSFDLIKDLSSECFMPLCYGGGVHDIKTFETLYRLGIEKVAINNATLTDLGIIEQASNIYGSQSIVGCIDYKRNLLRRDKLFDHCRRKSLGIDPIEQARRLVEAGVGELFINSVDRDGAMTGYDTAMTAQIANAVSVPIISCGGAGTYSDLADPLKAGASAAAAGSLFVFRGKSRGVLINYPSQEELNNIAKL